MRMRGTPTWTCSFRRAPHGSARLLHESPACAPDVMALPEVGDSAPGQGGDVRNEEQIDFSDDAIWKEIGVSSKGT